MLLLPPQTKLTITQFEVGRPIPFKILSPRLVTHNDCPIGYYNAHICSDQTRITRLLVASAVKTVCQNISRYIIYFSRIQVIYSDTALVELNAEYMFIHKKAWKICDENIHLMPEQLCIRLRVDNKSKR